MTEQELREIMQAKLKVSGLQESVSKIAEMLADAYNRGFQDAMDIAAEIYAQKPQKKGE